MSDVSIESRWLRGLGYASVQRGLRARETPQVHRAYSPTNADPYLGGYVSLAIMVIFDRDDDGIDARIQLVLVLERSMLICRWLESFVLVERGRRIVRTMPTAFDLEHGLYKDNRLPRWWRR